jgi:DNA-binding MarR family transcriptional regulator
MAPVHDTLSMEMQQRISAFVRAFGLLRPDETPCGASVPVSEAHALAVLADHGPLPQRSLGEALGLTKSTISRLVDQIERRGWARRTAGRDDARERLVELTAEGRRTADEIASRRAERMAQILERIPQGDRPAVLAALDALVEATRAT